MASSASADSDRVAVFPCWIQMRPRSQSRRHMVYARPPRSPCLQGQTPVGRSPFYPQACPAQRPAARLIALAVPRPLVLPPGARTPTGAERKAYNPLFRVGRRLFLQLAEHRIDVDALVDWLRFRGWNAKHFKLARGSGHRARGADFRRHEGLAAIIFDLGPFLGGAVDLEVEVNLRAQAQRHRVHRLKIGRVP